MAWEASDSLAADTYANILCVKAGNENQPAIKALIEALGREQVKNFIESIYEGAVVPFF